MDLKNKIAVVTGATGGIGRELVKELDSEGAQLLLIATSEDELQKLLKTLDGKDNSYLVCDLSNQSATQDRKSTRLNSSHFVR
jgi:short-subunit dehydrogenase